MKPVLLDTWHDLRAKRLLPVAALLLVALLAIPVFLLKPAKADTDAAPIANSAPQAAPTQLTQTTENAPGTGSNLGVFEAKDPFKAGKPALPSASAAVAEVVVEEKPPIAGGGDRVAVLPILPVGPDGEIVKPGPAPGPAPSPRRVTKTFEYVVDATFSNGDRRRQVKGLRKLGMLPNESAPLLIFMGVTRDGGNATFLVDSTLDAAGEGSCKPSREDCALVVIGAGAEETFTDAKGATYRLRVDEIRRVELKAGTSRAAPARASGQAPRRFVSPLMPDEVVDTVIVGASSPRVASSPAEKDR